MLATPLSRSSLLAGRALKEFAPLVVQAVLLTVVTVPFGFDLYPVHVLAGLVLLGVFGIGVGALSYSLALVTRKLWKSRSDAPDAPATVVRPYRLTSL